MQVFYFEPQETFIIDILAWLFFHLGIGYWVSQLPIQRFDPDSALYQTYTWEKNGEIYHKIFRVRSWKKFIPFGGKLYPNTFSLQKIENIDFEYLTLWLRESCRSEYCHWMMILPGFLFFFWNSVTVGWWMVIYAVSNNLVPIVLQRFNRPRMRRLLQYIEKKPRYTILEPATGIQYEQEVLNSYC